MGNGRFDDVIVEGVVGLRRHGKTTFCRRRVEHESRVVVVDPHDQFSREIATTFHDGASLAAYLRAPEHRAPRMLRVRLVSSSPADFEDVVEALLECGGRLLFCIDEVQLFCHPITGRPNPRLAWCIDNGRNFGIAMLWSARRIPQVGQLLAGQTETLYAFKVVGEADLEHLRGRFGRERSEQLRHLKQFQYLRSQE